MQQKKIRNFENAKGIEDKTFIIALTANAMVEDKERCMEAGMNNFISKPFKEESLRKVLNQATKSIVQ